MARQTEERDSYYIPPNFVDTGNGYGRYVQATECD